MNTAAKTQITAGDVDVSIIVVNYNAGVFLARSVAQALKSQAAVQVLVVDNASDDNSLALLEAECGTNKNVEVIRLNDNVGFGAAVNVAADRAIAPYVMLLNPDCFLRPTTISGLVDVMQTRPQAGIAGPVVFDTAGIEQRGARREEPTPARAVARSFGRRAGTAAGGYDLNRSPIPDDITCVDAVSGSCLLVERALFDQLQRMDESFFLHCEDLDLCRRVRDAGREVVFVPGHSVIHVQGASGRNVAVERYKHRSMIRYFDKHHASDTSPWLAALLKTGVWARFGVVSARAVVKPPLRLSDRQELERIEMLLSPPAEQGVLVTGATSFVAEPLLQLLNDKGEHVLAVSRRVPRAATGNLSWFTFDYLSKVPAHEFTKPRALIHLAPIWVLPDIIRRVFDLGVSRVVAVGSSSVETKKDSSNNKDLSVAKKIADAENDIHEAATDKAASVVIFHPTLVYDSQGRDQNVGRLLRFARRFRFLPVVEPSAGMRQPLHASDLAALCESALHVAPGTRERVFVAGGETLSYRKMLERIAAVSTPATQLVRVPVGLFRTLLDLAGKVPMGPDLNGAMLDRVNQDMVFSNDKAQSLFAFRPRQFEPEKVERATTESQQAGHTR